MIIKTKFEPGQEVWVMQDNKPIKLTIKHINIFANLNISKQIIYEITYILTNTAFGDKFRENEIYTTKEDLKNSLFD